MTSRPLIFRVLTLLYLVAVAVLCFANFHSLPEVEKTFFGIPADKVVHFLMFLPFPTLAFYSLKLRQAPVFKVLLALVLLFVVGCLIAWATEYVQGLLPYRDMDMADFRADRIGLAAGCLLTFLIQLIIHPKTNA